jgi:chromosome segregation ATPase
LQPDLYSRRLSAHAQEEQNRLDKVHKADTERLEQQESKIKQLEGEHLNAQTECNRLQERIQDHERNMARNEEQNQARISGLNTDKTRLESQVDQVQKQLEKQTTSFNAKEKEYYA